jgi:hypothetical protein
VNEGEERAITLFCFLLTLSQQQTEQFQADNEVNYYRCSTDYYEPKVAVLSRQFLQSLDHT